MKKIIIVFILLSSLSSNTFSQQQSYIHLPENVQMEILLDTTVTTFFDNNVYMDIWERLWIKSDRSMACIDFMNDSLEVNYITLEDQPKINDICWLSNGDMIIANDSVLLLLDDTGYQIISNLPYPNMQIAPADTNSIYIFGQSIIRKEYDISLLNMAGEITRLFSLNDEVKEITGNGIVSIVTLNKEILLFSQIVEPTVFYRTDSEIRSISVTDFGDIFIATQEGITFFEKMERAYTFCNVGTKKLWNIDDKLFALFDDGKFAVIYPISRFEKFTQIEILEQKNNN